MDLANVCRHVETQVHNILCVQINVSSYIEEAVYRTNKCLADMVGRYYDQEQGASFSVFNTVQYSIFLYHLSRVAIEMDGNEYTAEKAYYLNKILHSVDIFYEVKLPAIWGCEHPLGSVMGRATYGNHFFFYQGCTVGGSSGKYPVLGENVFMYSNSKILGDSHIGNNVILSANAYVKAENIPDNCIVFGQSPNLLIKRKSAEEIRRMTDDTWKN